MIFYRLIEKLKTLGGSDDKDTRVQVNSSLNDYYANKGKYPQKLLTELITASQDLV
jgi:hypothetical protein